MISTLLAQRSFWLETPASTSAVNHDLVFYILLYVMTFFFFLVIGIMCAFVVVYRRRKGQVPEEGPTHNTPLEVMWTIVPLGIVLGFFVLGLRYYVDLEAPPANADVVDVEASQWHFNFKYPNGAESDDLYLRVDRPVVLKLTSKDVSHAVYITAFRMQRNAVPGRITQLWVKPTELTGTNPENSFHVFCTQYCGNGHAEMHANCYVLNKEDYDKKLAEAANIFVDKNKKPLPLAEVGQKLYKSTCSQCHSVDGSPGTAPTWKGLYKSNVAFSKSDVSGYALTENDDDEKWNAYLVESILHPEAKIVQGFQNVMPSQESGFSDTPGGPPPKLSVIVAAIEANKETTNKEKKLVAITEYIKSVGDPKYYHAMKTPETYTPKVQTTAGADAATIKDAATGKPEKTANAEKTATPEKTSKESKPQTPDRFAGRPSDEPIDKSETPHPAVRKEEQK